MSRSDLTRREFDLARLLVRGFSLDEMAAELNISIHTIDSHLRQMRGKLGARNGRHLAVLCYQLLNGDDDGGTRSHGNPSADSS